MDKLSKNILSSPNEKDPKKDPLFNQTNIDENLLKYIEQNFPDCSICLTTSVIPYKLEPCKHIFCLKCIKIWMKINKKCPLCRRTILRLLKYKNY